MLQHKSIELKADEAASSGPPRPPFGLMVGITGHRLNRLDEDAQTLARERLAHVFAQLVDAAAALHSLHARWFTESPPDIRLMSALAEGADRIAADAALAAGLTLDAVLPFAREEYRRDFSDPRSAATFDTLLSRSDIICELPGSRLAEETAYTLAGAAMLSVADVMVALWNGEGSAGRGGTGDVVATALSQGKTVIHVPVTADKPIRILWPGDGPGSGSWQSAIDPPTRPFEQDILQAILGIRLAPPADPAEQRALSAFLAEKQVLTTRRIEYPLLLWIVGAAKLSRSAWRREPYRHSTRPWWAPFDAMLNGSIDPLRHDRLETAYAWADNLATRFAQNFRSGHVINFAFSAIAIALALMGLLFGSLAKIGFVMVELVLIAAIVVNTRIGHRQSWQQRWLDYRQLAERLRPMRSLKLLAVAQPPDVSASSRTGNPRWIDWYAGAIWRQLALPRGRIDEDRLHELIALLKEQEIAPEIRYHQKNAHRMAHVHHRLHQFGSICFGLTVLLCVGFLFYAAFFTKSHTTAIIFSVLTAALPAFGSAAYGLRVQGDFAGSAARSAATAHALQEVNASLTPDGSLTRTAALSNAAAVIMLVDLAEWRLTYEQRRLEIPG